MTPQQALATLQAQCSRSEYCTGQVRKKLLLWDSKERSAGRPGFSAECVDGIIASLVKEKFVDDCRFAGAYVRDKARFAKWGPVKISCQLRRMGVAGNVIEDAIRENSQLFAGDVLGEIIRKKWDSIKGEEDLQKKKAKVLRFAVAKGFSYGEIMDVIKDFR